MKLLKLQKLQGTHHDLPRRQVRPQRLLHRYPAPFVTAPRAFSAAADGHTELVRPPVTTRIQQVCQHQPSLTSNSRALCR